MRNVYSAVRKADKPNLRSRKGVVMGVADLVIVIPLFVVSVFFLTDLVQIGISRERLCSVLTQAAHYAVMLPPDVNPIGATEPVVKELCVKNNLTINKMKVEVAKVTIADCEAISVKAAGDLPLLQGSMLPAMFSIQDSAAELYPANRVYSVIAISPYPYSSENAAASDSIYIPIIRPRSGTPIWQFPYDAALNNLHVVQGIVPPPPTPEAPNSYFRDRPSLY